MSADWDLDDAITVTDVRTAGGIAQDGTVAATVHLQIVGNRVSDGTEVVLPFIMDLERYFVMMARLEYAGKTALLVEQAAAIVGEPSRVSPG